MKFYDKGHDVIIFLKDLLGLTVGTALCGLGYALFLIPFKSAPGGVGGLSQIFYYLFKMPAGLSMLLFNIPLFIVGYFTLGRNFSIKSLIAILLTSLFTDLFSYKNMLTIPSIADFLYKINDQGYSFTSEIFLGVVAGSLLLGAGIGIVFRFNGSTGGTDIPALLLKKYTGMSVGTAFLIIDTGIIFLVGIIFRNGNLILWGLISLFISAKVTDYVMEGFPHTKGAFIITEFPEPIKQFILKNLDRGCTIFKGEGGYTGKGKDIVYVVINLRELTKLKETIKKYDRNAFIIINDVTEALGYGFKEF